MIVSLAPRARPAGDESGAPFFCAPAANAALIFVVKPAKPVSGKSGMATSASRGSEIM